MPDDPATGVTRGLPRGADRPRPAVRVRVSESRLVAKMPDHIRVNAITSYIRLRRDQGTGNASAADGTTVLTAFRRSMEPGREKYRRCYCALNDRRRGLGPQARGPLDNVGI